MCLTETYGSVRVDKHFSDVFPIKSVLKHGDTLLPLFFSFALEKAVRRVRVSQNGLKLNGTHQLLVYADDVNILGGSVRTIKKNTEVLFVASKKMGLEVNADTTKYMAMSRDQNARRSRSIRIDNTRSFFGRVEYFKYLGKIRIKILFGKNLRAH
jgi:hypothetical protein